MSAFEVITARIETLSVDAIVNPANARLAPGGGADGAIRRAAGVELDRLLDQTGGLAEGAALVTPGFALPARWVVHTVAPVWPTGRPEREKIALLSQCYRSCIEAAADLRMKSIAFPAIGAGAYGWPITRAADIAISSSRDAAARFTVIETVVFCCFTESDANVYRARLAG